MRLIRISVALLVVAGAVATAGTQALAKGDGPKDFKANTKIVKAKSPDSHTTIFKEEIEVKGKDFGKSKVKCEVGNSIDCSGTWRLDDGVIKAKGSTPIGKSTLKLKIKSGKAAYKGAKGTIEIKSTGTNENKETFNFK